MPLKARPNVRCEPQTMTDAICTSHRITLPLAELKQGMDGIAEMIWQELTAFQDWHAWMPAIKEVKRIDEGVLSRGSELQVYTHNSVKVWSVSCWDPPRRIEFIVRSQSKDLAFGFSLIPDDENKQLTVVLDLECLPRGLFRLISPLLSWQQRQYGQKLLNAFVESLQE